MGDGQFPITVYVAPHAKRYITHGAVRAHIAKLTAELPSRSGKRVLLAVERHVRSSGHSEYFVLAQCDCGRRTRIQVWAWRRAKGGGACGSCAALTRARREGWREGWRNEGDGRPPPTDAGELDRCRNAFRNLPIEQDPYAQQFMAAFPGGATLETIGDFYAISRERVRQLEAQALRRLRKACQEQGLALEDFLCGAAHPGSRRWQAQPWGDVMQPENKS